VTTDELPHDTPSDASATGRERVRHYEIRVEGRLAPSWSPWFHGLAVEADAAGGTTTIRGAVVDQAALHGLLQKLRDLGIPLLSLNEIPTHTSGPTGRATQQEH
jgi:hypothetical protein